jgi:hypothetical protein
MTVSSKDQVIARLVREVLQSWGPDDLESFAREQLTKFYEDNPDELIESAASFKIDDTLETKPTHWWTTGVKLDG